MAIVPRLTQPGYAGGAGAPQLDAVGHAQVFQTQTVNDTDDLFSPPVLVVGFNSFQIELFVDVGGDTVVDGYARIIDPLTGALVGARVSVVSAGVPGTFVGRFGAFSGLMSAHVWHTIEIELIGTGGVAGSFASVMLWAGRR